MHADHHDEHEETIPRWMLVAVGVMLLTILSLVAIHRAMDAPRSAMPTAAPVAIERVLLFRDQPDGRLAIYDDTGALVANWTTPEAGFVAGVWRAVRRVRDTADVAGNPPLILRSYENGRLQLVDPATGWPAELIGFGIDNAEVFNRLLHSGASGPQGDG